MFTFLADLFAPEPTARRTATFQPELTAMEDRYAPAVIANPTETVGSSWQHPGTIRGFNPQPEPPVGLGG